MRKTVRSTGRGRAARGLLLPSRAVVLLLCLACLPAAQAQKPQPNGTVPSSPPAPAVAPPPTPASGGTAAPQPAPLPEYPDPILRVEDARLRRFDDALAALAAQGKVAVIAEGAPYRPALSDGALQSLSRAVSQDSGGVPLSKFAAEVGRAFDYDAVRVDRDLFLFYKRYSEPNDLPVVTFEEAVRALRGIVRATDRLNPRAPQLGSPGFPLLRFVNSLDPQQMHALKDGLLVTQLRPDQREWLWQFARQDYLQRTMDSVERTARHLETTRSRKSVFRRMDLVGLGIPIFGYEGPFGLRGAVWQFALSHGFRMQTGGVSLLTAPDGSMMVFGLLTRKPPPERVEFLRGKIGGHLPDPNAPTPEDYADIRRPAPPSAVAATLQSVVERLNAAALPKETTPSTTAAAVSGRQEAAAAAMFRGAAVDEALQSKPVSVVGVEAIAPERVLQALADLYGLHVQQQEDGLRLLTLRPVRPARTIRDIPATVGRLLPEPWRRAVVGGAQREESELVDLAKQRRLSDGRERPLNSHDIEVIRRMDAPDRSRDVLYAKAVRRLRALAEPKVAAAPEERLAIAEVGDEERRLLALLVSIDVLRPLETLINRLPPRSLVDFSRAYVQGEFGPNNELRGVMMGYRDESGRLWREMQMGVTSMLPR